MVFILLILGIATTSLSITIRKALAVAAIPATFSVVERKSVSCPPPVSNGEIRFPSLIYRKPTPRTP